MVRLLLRPRWIFGTLLVLVVAVAFVELGFWQIRRLHERRDFNASVTRAERETPRPLSQVLRGGSSADPDTIAYQRVVVRGTYDTAREVILFGRSRNEEPGNHVLTPLRTTDGTALVVDRGWVPLAFDTPPLTQGAPPTGTVTATGILWPAEESGPPDPADDPVTQFAKIDLDGLQGQLPYRIEPVYLWLQSQQPAQPSGVPATVPLPPLSEGPHLSYAIQWFIFATIAVAGYVLLIRKELQRQGRDPAQVDPTTGVATSREP
jgi:cytochrome oxidase assembly protein ShyY1